MAITAETRQDIIELVVTAFNAAPGTELLNELVAIADEGSIADVAAFLTAHAEWSKRYPAFQTAEEFAEEWLGNLIPEADADTMAEAKSIAVGLVNGGATFAEIILEAQGFLSAASEDDAAFGTSIANFNNKVEVATTYTITNESTGLNTDVLSGVTSDDATVEGAATIPTAGATFKLTTGADVKTLGAGDDTINATHLTLTSGDIVDAGDGSDTLILDSTGTTAFSTSTGAKISGIETVKVTNINGANVGASAAVTEKNVVTFSDVAVGKTVILGGLTMTATGGTAAAADIATAFANGATEGNAAITGTLSGWTITSDGNIATFTSSAAGNVTDLADTGTAKTATSKSVAYAFTNSATAQNDAVTVTINGQDINVFMAAGTPDKTTIAAELSTAIDGYLGADVSSAATGTLTVTGDYNIAVKPAAAGDFTYTVTPTAAVSASGPTLTKTEGAAKVAGSYAGDTVAASNFLGATSYVNELSESKVNFTSVPSTAEVTIKGNGSVTTGDTNVTFASTASSPVINITGGTKGGAVTMTASKGSSLTITSDGAPLTSTGKIGTNTIGALTTTGLATSTLTIDADSNLSTGSSGTTVGSQKIVVTGDATNVKLGTITNSGSNLTSIDASGMAAGGVTASLTTTITELKGGAGADTITSAQLADATAVIDAGDGVDTLVATPAHIDTLAESAAYQNFEVLVHAGPNFNQNLMPGISALAIVGGGAATATVTNLSGIVAGGGITVYNSGNAATTATFSLANSAGTSDTLGLNLGGSLTATSWNAANITTALAANGFETINLTARPSSTKTGASAKSTVAAFTADKATAINLKGTSFILSNIATTKAVTIDGSALTGDRAALTKDIVGFTTAGSAKAGSTIIGSNFNDTFTVGAEGSTYNGGDGIDEFSLTAAVLLPDGTTDAVLDGGAGSKDKITITGTQTLTDVHFTNVSNMEQLNLNATTAVSVTGLAAGAKAAYADGMTVTSGTLADGATYTFGAGLYDKGIKLTLVSSGDGASTADNVAVTTGGGDDTVSVTAASWVGTAGAAGLLTVSTGAGDDTIAVTTGTLLKVTTSAPVTITGGKGADKITSTGVESDIDTGVLTTTYVIAAGDSPLDGYDSITGFDVSGTNLASQKLDFDNVSLTSYAATAASGYTSATLTVTVSSKGVVTFGGSKATAGLTLQEKIDAVASVVVTNNGDTAYFEDGDDSYVFNKDTNGDSLVKLVGLASAGVDLETTNGDTASVGAGSIFIG